VTYNFAYNANGVAVETMIARVKAPPRPPEFVQWAEAQPVGPTVAGAAAAVAELKRAAAVESAASVADAKAALLERIAGLNRWG
jgi:hypothetical protein